MEPSYHDKQSWEIHKVSVAMADSIASGDSLKTSTLEVKAFDSSGTDVSTSLVSSSTVSGTTVTITVKGGTDGEDYDIRVRIETNAGEKLEDDLTLRIRDKS